MTEAEFNLADALGNLILAVDGKEPTPQQVALYCKSLADQPVQHVRDAFRVTLEEDDRFIFSRIMRRVREKDGRPAAEAMWLEVCADESQTVWRTDEANEALPQTRVSALGVAVAENDKQQIAQIRDAFKRDYDEAVKIARREGRPIRWHESIGFDKHHRESKMKEAVLLGRVSVDHAQMLLPDFSGDVSEKTKSIINEIYKSSSMEVVNDED